MQMCIKEYKTRERLEQDEGIFFLKLPIGDIFVQREKGVEGEMKKNIKPAVTKC